MKIAGLPNFDRICAVPAITSRLIEFAAKWLPGLLLCAVVTNHAYRVQVDGLNPRTGGGFGMFAVVDRTGSRAFYADGVDDEGNRRRIFIDFDGAGSLDELSERTDRRVRTMPDDASVERLAEMIFRARYQVEDPRVFANLKGVRETLDRLPAGVLDQPYFRSFTPREEELSARGGIRLKGMRFQLRSVVFDSDTTSYFTEPLTPWIVKGEW